MNVTYPDRVAAGEHLVVTVDAAGEALIDSGLAVASQQQDLKGSQSVDLGSVTADGVFSVLIKTDTDSYTGLVVTASGDDGFAISPQNGSGGLFTTPVPIFDRQADGGDAIDHFFAAFTLDILRAGVADAFQKHPAEEMLPRCRTTTLLVRQ